MASRVDYIMKRQEETLRDVRGELSRQLYKWGEQSHSPLYWLGILGEEVGEACKAVIESDHTHRSMDETCVELTHVAAVAIAAVESIRRQYE